MKTIVTIKFGAHRIPGGIDTILGPTQCGPDVVKINEYMIGGGVNRPAVDVTLTLDDADERVSKVLALLAPHGENDWVLRQDIYTEEELQTAPLLLVDIWTRYLAATGPHYGTTYDLSQACQRCGTGARQTSPLMISNDDVRGIEKLRIAMSNYFDLLVSDMDAEKLVAANLSGTLLWPIYAKTKNGTQIDVRRQQVFAEHVMPPMAPSSLIDRTAVCPQCRRGCFRHLTMEPRRLVYRREDLANIQDINLTWEWFGDYAGSPEEALAGRWPKPRTLITPKVMNLLRGKTKKEQKYQGCDFVPIWVDDDEV